MMPSLAFNPRRAHAATTEHAPDPTPISKAFLTKEVKPIGDKLRRATMSVSHTNALLADYSSSPFVDSGAMASGAARCHRLADSQMRAILVCCFQSLLSDPTNQAKRDAFRNYCTAFKAPKAVSAVEKAVEDWPNHKKATATAGLQMAHNMLSVNTTNVRPGDAEINERIANSWDPNLDGNGCETPISVDIRAQVEQLVAANLIPRELADSALTQATDKATGQALSSTMQGWD